MERPRDGRSDRTRSRETRPARGAGGPGFTLVEVLVAMTILLLASSITMTAYLSVLKRAVHSERMLQGAGELRYATDVISQAVRSAPLTPVVQNGGLQLVVAPKDLGYATVLETTWIDAVRNVKGSKANQRMLKVSNVTPAAVVSSVFSSSSRPAGALSATEVASYFTDASSLPVADLSAFFAVGDTITIPATAYGPQTTGVINSMSNNPGNKTLTLTAALGVDVPNGTKILASSGRRMLLSVETSGDLRYYPDHRNLTRFMVIAHNIDAAPLSDPANTGSARTVPFAIAGRYLTLNLQQVPRGTIAGRTVQGVQTTVFTRTDPLLP